MTREKLVLAGNIPPERLHEKALLFVCAAGQSQALEHILPALSEAELDIYKRGRNAKSRVPRSATVADYRRATGFECLFGWLYLRGEQARVRELFNIAYAHIIL